MKSLAGLTLAMFTACALTCAQSSTPASGVDLKAIDKSVDPCTNFYQYACGNWLKENPIPPQYGSWGRFNELAKRNQEILRGILEDSAKNESRSPIDQKIGAFYSSCMDEKAVEKAGYAPIKPGLQRIEDVKTKAELAGETARLQEEGVTSFFAFRPSPDFDQSTVNLAFLDQGGLGLPDKSYYVDPKEESLRQKYVQHISKMFQLIGSTPAEADAKAKAVMEIETNLAKGSMDRVTRRNPNLLRHKMSVSAAEELTPNFKFDDYFKDIQAPPMQNVNVTVPDFFKELNSVLGNTSLADLKSYLTWHYVSSNADLLSSAFVNENFDFYSRTLNGTKELRPRWKRCVELTDRSFGEALGQKYVEKAFGEQAKVKTRELVSIIEKEMKADIDSLTWMSDTTKQQAFAKLQNVTNKIGYPDKWRDYSSVKVVNGDLVGDEERAREFEIRRELNKIGKPVDRAEFGMTPPTVNAYYNPLQNNINFPAGILQPPFYQDKADMAANLGGIGVVVGHELTHGFDDQGRRFDADGNLRDWWTKQDAEEFNHRADCLVNEYSKFSPVEGTTLNGRLTLGENGADNAGIRLAYMALLGGLENGSVDKQKLDGYTPQQRFFLGFAQIWCENQRPESLRNRARTDPHSPGQFRVIGTVQNIPEFGQAFGCTAGQPMEVANGCRVW